MNGEPVPYAMYFCGQWEKDSCFEDIENEKRGAGAYNRVQGIFDRMDEKPSEKKERRKKHRKKQR